MVTRFLSPFAQGVIIFFSLYIFITDLESNGIVKSVAVAIFYYIFYWLFWILITAFEATLKTTSKYNYSHIIELQDNALYEETSINRSYFKFIGIYKVVFSAGVSVVYVAPNVGFFIPNNCFKSPQEKADFFNTLKVKISNEKET